MCSKCFSAALSCSALKSSEQGVSINSKQVDPVVIRPFCRLIEDGRTAELLWAAFSHISWKSWAKSELDETLLSRMCQRNHVFSWCFATGDKMNSIQHLQKGQHLRKKLHIFTLCDVSKDLIFTCWTCAQPCAPSLLLVRWSTSLSWGELIAKGQGSQEARAV